MRRTAYIHIKEDDGETYVDPIMPKILHVHKSVVEWEIFCEKINKALIPADEFKLRQRISLPILVGYLILLVINITLTQIVFEREGGIDIWDYIAICHFISSLILVISFTTDIVKWNYSLGSIREEISLLCEEMDNEQQEVRVLLQDHLFKRRGNVIPFYIEVRESNTTTLDSLKKIFPPSATEKVLEP